MLFLFSFFSKILFTDIFFYIFFILLHKKMRALFFSEDLIFPKNKNVKMIINKKWKLPGGNLKAGFYHLNN